MSSDPRYTMFRNYMVNELGITKEDIENWTKAAVEREVVKVAASLPLESIAEKVIRSEVNTALHNVQYGDGQTRWSARTNLLRDAIALELAKRFSLGLVKESTE